MTKFTITYHVESTLDVTELWPDGDAPANSTVQDVIALIKNSGGIYRVLDDWNLREEANYSVTGE
jgi:hypothetical protein